MIAVLLLLAGLAAGIDVRRVLALASVVFVPFLVVVPIAFLVWRAKPGEDNNAGIFCEAVAAELRAGASLRSALVAGLESSGAEELASDRLSVVELSDVLESEFPPIRDELRLTVSNASRSGSDVAAIFDEIGSLAIAQDEIRREVRTATAPGRATALVLTGAPALFVSTQIASGSLGDLLISPQQRFVTLLGLALFATGLSIALGITWRSGR